MALFKLFFGWWGEGKEDLNDKIKLKTKIYLGTTKFDLLKIIININTNYNSYFKNKS